jgi:hypothetical protein
MKFKKSLNEVIDMNNQDFSGTSWDRAKRLWNKLSKEYKVYPTDYEGLISFEKFFSTFLKEKGKEPSLQDASEFLARKQFPHINNEH